MSRKGNCWDNSVMERFFVNLKMERVWQKDYANPLEAINDIADGVVGFYNNIRLHSKLGNLPPNAFERESTSKKLVSLSEITWPPHACCAVHRPALAPQIECLPNPSVSFRFFLESCTPKCH